MTDPLQENFCCCQIFYIMHGAFLIAGHSFLQGTYGILVIVTSYYQKKDVVINMVTVAANICLFPAGILVFAATLFSNYHAARVSAFFFTITTFFNFCSAFCYGIWYINFEANSQLDRIFFWKYNNDWVARGQLPFTLWHVLATSIFFVLIVWFYYSFKLWKFAKILKMKHDLENESDEKRRETVSVEPKESEV